MRSLPEIQFLMAFLWFLWYATVYLIWEAINPSLGELFEGYGTSLRVTPLIRSSSISRRVPPVASAHDRSCLCEPGAVA